MPIKERNKEALWSRMHSAELTETCFGGPASQRHIHLQVAGLTTVMILLLGTAIIRAVSLLRCLGELPLIGQTS